MASRRKERKTGGDDLISERARALGEQIATLQQQIKKLDSQLQTSTAKPRLRSTALPHGRTLARKPEPAPPKPAAEPVFEEIKSAPPPAADPDLYNELGVRKYDLPGLWNRIRNHFRAPAASNPRLINYLAAGGVRGLRPLRYEKRVARNRVIAMAAFLFFLLLGIILIFMRHR
ncbi:MAG: hypothetical protein KGR98_04995 [Verrucomicrobia bacterium]|nr:hypothetical protein [Verrucomicrobiota bacterium]MDE3099816.1 hypothetical protein [Verrucomicrobiota bacterium]